MERLRNAVIIAAVAAAVALAAGCEKGPCRRRASAWTERWIKTA